MRVSVLIFCILISLLALADDDQVLLITDQQTRSECSDCHFAYPAAMLPKLSWKNIMKSLDNHFGEDASLDTQTMLNITNYLVANAGDTEQVSSVFVRGIDRQNPPIRITETNYWIRKHPAISKEKLPSGLAGLMTNCIVCHLKAENGYYKKD